MNEFKEQLLEIIETGKTPSVCKSAIFGECAFLKIEYRGTELSGGVITYDSKRTCLLLDCIMKTNYPKCQLTDFLRYSFEEVV